MSKIILEFNLPEDTQDFESAYNGWKYKSFIDEFDNTFFRRAIKYDSLFDKEPTEAEYALIEKLRTAYWELYKETMDE